MAKWNLGGTRILGAAFALLASAGLVLVTRSPERPQFEARVYVGSGVERMPYRLYVPPGYDSRKRYPLVVWLHGSDAIGNNNLSQIAAYNTPGTQVWIRPDHQRDFPAIVVAPQSAERYWAIPLLKEATLEERLVFEIIAALQQEFSIDADRIYLAGQSMGGFGVWALLARRPDLFAAGIVLCGPGVPIVVERISHIPVWVFHGAKDDRVPVKDGRGMVELLRKAGGQPRYTEYPDLGHAVGRAAFNEKDLLPWLFAQRRSAAHDPFR